jgi:Tfp pilus assembly protein PilX
MVKIMTKSPLFGRSNELNFRSQSGQVAVIVFLIMAVLLVVGLSLATRTSREIELAGQQEDTTRVFNAAETGIEEALSDVNNFTGAVPTPSTITDPDTQTTRTVTIEPESGFENEFLSGETATVYTTGTSGAFNIWWNRTGTTCGGSAVIAVTVYVENSADNYTAEHYGVRPLRCTDSGTNFQTSDNVAAAEGHMDRFQIASLPANTRMVRIKPLRAATSIKITAANGVLSEQLYNIRSEAQDAASGNTEVRAIEVTRTRPAPPSIFDYALYSGGNLTK